MSCYSPLKAFDIGETNKGKRKYKITGLDVDHLEKDKNGNWIKVYDSYVSDMAHDIKRKFIEIPCGKCIGCRLSYAKQWSERCLMELEGHKSSYFVTLTYDDINLPMTTFVEPENGVICEINTLVKEDFRNFMKALRQATNQKIRYFACGEYGTQTVRPHYHAILFGLELDDLVPYGQNGRGDYLYNSPLLQKIWKKGFVVVGSVTRESCNYVARYVMKKVDVDSKEFTDRNMQPEFITMSTHPGIGKDFLDRHPKLFEYDYITVKSPAGETSRETQSASETVSIPRYFYRLKEKESTEFVRSKKIKMRKFSKSNREMKKLSTDKNYPDMLRTEEAVKIASIKQLKKREVNL